MLETDCDPTLERHFKGHKEPITAVTIHPNNDQLITCSLDKTLMLWNSDSGDRALRFCAHREAVLDVDFAPSGQVVASASKDKCVRIWIPKITGETQEFAAHMSSVNSVRFSPDGQNVNQFSLNFSVNNLVKIKLYL